MSTGNKLRAFVLYSADDRIVPSVLVKRYESPNPTNGTWVEVPARLCCPYPGSAIPSFFRTHGDLRAFIKYDKEGNVISSSTTLRHKKVPRISKSPAKWVEIPYRRCCIFTTTTTTSTSTSTTSSTTTTTTTQP
jgi:hypothetical protein